MELVHIVGNRPQFIKLATLLRAMNEVLPDVESKIIHTGQHYSDSLSSSILNQLKIRPMINLQVGSGTHAEQTANILLRLDPILSQNNPSLVIVYGDTNSTLAGALTAVKREFPIVHVEAGLRNFPSSYSPENVNRIITDHCSTLLFCPTSQACENLLDENISEKKIFKTGDITYDSFLHSLPIAREYSVPLYAVDDFILVTAHRPELVDNRNNLRSFLSALITLSKTVKIVFPAHPRTVSFLKKYSLYNRLKKHENIVVSKPLSYYSFLSLLLRTNLVLTDSGGVFKEALFARKPVINLCSSFPYPRLFKNRFSVLTGPDKDKIVSTSQMFLNRYSGELKPRSVGNHFGSGKSGEKMTGLIKMFLEV